MRPIEAFLDIARDEGVDRIFGNPGTTELPLTGALAGRDGPAYVLGLHEGSVVAMADGYARMTRRPSLVSLHVAAGVANGLIGMLNAARSRTPMVITAGQQDRRHLRHDPMLSGDLVAMTRGVVKSATQVEHAHDLPLVLRRAFAEAVRPPSGPVFVAIPMDLLDEDADVAVPPRSAPPEPTVPASLAEAAGLLAAARNPAIIAGDGVGRDQAAGELAALAEALGAVVYPQPMHDRVNMPGGHPLCAPMPPPTSAGIRDALRAHDIVLIAGCHAFMAHHYTPGGPIPEGTEVVQADADPAEIGRNFPVRVALAGELAHTLRALVLKLHGRVPGAAERTARTSARLAAERDAARAAASEHSGRSPMDPAAAMLAVADALPDGAVVVEEAITAGIALRRVLALDAPDSYMHTIGGGLGWGIGAAVGARMGTDRPVLAVLGDGCAAFGVQGLWTAARHRVPVAFLVVNNREYRTLKDTTDRRRRAPGPFAGLDLDDPPIDWTAAGRAFGVHAVRAGDESRLAELVADVGHLDGPLLIEAPVAGHADHAGANRAAAEEKVTTT